MLKNLIIICFFLFPANGIAQVMDTIDLRPLYHGRMGGFSVYQFKTDSYVRYNVDHCRKRLSPCSTFKIPNSLIGLETGIVPDSGFVIQYDSLMHPRDAEMLKLEPFKHWFQDLSLKMAFQYSCVWYYQELARRIGHERMAKYVGLLEYGNRDISGGDDTFWLCGSIQISINEQIEFLKKLYSHRLNGISDKSVNTVKDIMLVESTPQYTLYGKSGSGDCVDGKWLAWYVGFVEAGPETSVFAMNIIVDNFDELKNNFRIELTKNVLKELKIIN